MEKKLMKYIKWIIFAFLFVTPLILMGDKYVVGGDDMKLYYIFPQNYLKNFTFNIASDNTLAGALTGYSSVAYFAPFYAIIWFLKTVLPFLNVQALLYGANFAFGFLFFYKFLGLYITNEKSNISKIELVKITSAVFYIFSPFLNHTLFSHQLMHMYLVSIVPTIFFLFFKGIRENNLHYSLAAILVFSAFTTTIMSMPYFGAYLICLLPLFIYEFTLYPKIFLKHFFFSCFAFVGLNMYWILHVGYSTLYNTGLQQVFSGNKFINENVRIASGVSRLFSPLNQIFQTFTAGTYKLDSISILNIFYLVAILLGGFIAQKQKFSYYFVFSLSFLLAVFFFSPNFGSWGPDIFVWMTQNIPTWGMFRNMYDKFASTLALTYAFIFGLSLWLIVSKIKNKKFLIGIFSISIFITLLNIPDLINPFSKDREGITRISGEFNEDFNNLVQYLKTDGGQARVAWLPLNFPAYAAIQDKNGEYYFGLSPLRELADRTDYTGKFSFLTQRNIFLGDSLFEWLQNGEYEKVGELYSQLGIKFIIVDHQNLPNSIQSFFYGGESRPLLKYQSGDFKNEILGKKVADFGNRYSLYEMNPRYMSDVIFINDAEFDNLSYNKISSEEYQTSIQNLKNSGSLSFLQPYNKQWTLYLENHGEKIPLESGQNTVLFDYANSWKIDKKLLEDDFHKYINKRPEGGVDLNLFLYFEPEKYNIVAYTISIVTFLMIIGFIILSRLYKYE